MIYELVLIGRALKFCCEINLLVTKIIKSKEISFKKCAQISILHKTGKVQREIEGVFTTFQKHVETKFYNCSKTLWTSKETTQSDGSILMKSRQNRFNTGRIIGAEFNEPSQNAISVDTVKHQVEKGILRPTNNKCLFYAQKYTALN